MKIGLLVRGFFSDTALIFRRFLASLKTNGLASLDLYTLVKVLTMWIEYVGGSFTMLFHVHVQLTETVAATTLHIHTSTVV